MHIAAVYKKKYNTKILAFTKKNISTISLVSTHPNLTEKQKKALEMLANDMSQTEYTPIELHNHIYEVSRTISAEPSAIFRAIYISLLGNIAPKAELYLLNLLEKGEFNKQVYMTFLNGRRMKAKGFEAIVRDDLAIGKLMKLLNKKAVPFERELVASALSIRDKIRYTVLTPDDVNLTVDEAELEKYWQEHKKSYQTPKQFRVSILWTETSDINASEEDLRNFYQKNSYNYTDAEGKEFGFEKARGVVEQDYRIKKGKKKALLDYIALKKGKKEPTEEKTLSLGDPLLSKALWDEVQQSGPGSLVKPKPVGTRYATLKIEEVIPPRPMTFEEAKASVEKTWKKKAKSELLTGLTNFSRIVGLDKKQNPFGFFIDCRVFSTHNAAEIN